MEHKKEAILRLIIAYKAVWGIAEILLGASFYRLVAANGEAPFKALAGYMRLNPDSEFVSAAIEHAGSIDNSLLFAFSAVVFIFGVLNLIESWGLHKRQRWAEWLTVIATSLLVPYELYHVVASFGLVKLLILVINVLIVYYLARHKELFKSRKETRRTGEDFL